MKLYSNTCLLFLAPACFGYSCNRFQGVSRYKYHKYNRNTIKYIITSFKTLCITKAAQNLFELPFKYGKILLIWPRTVRYISWNWVGTTVCCFMHE